MSTLQRDLALPETWQKSLERSRRRRELAARGRKEVARRKGASAAMATAMMAGPAAPFASAAQGGPGNQGGDTSAPASGGERQIEIRAGGLPLRFGYEGDLVAALQKGLGVESDGIFGPITEAAVKAFQRRAGLPVSGVVDPATWQALFSGAASQGTASSSSTAGPGPVVDLEAPRAAERAVAAPKAAPAVASTPAKARVRKAASTSKPAAPKPAAKPRTRSGDREERSAPRPERRSAPERHRPRKPARNMPAVDRGDSNEAPIPVSACGSSRLTKPVKGIKTSPFGPRGGRNHDGVDIAAPTGTAIRAVACGVITSRGAQSGYGNMICIKHTSRFSTCYAHMSRYAGISGRRVRAGQVIGYVGCTGSCTGPHLHFETRVDGRARNPEPYLRGGGIPGRPTVKRATVRRAPVRKATVRTATLKPSARRATTASRWSSAPSRPSATTATSSQRSGSSWDQKAAAPAPVPKAAPAPAPAAAPVAQAPTTAPAAQPAPTPVARQAPVAPQAQAPAGPGPQPAAAPQSQAPPSGAPAPDGPAEPAGPQAQVPPVPKLEEPEVEAPKVSVPKVSVPKVELPKAPKVAASAQPNADQPAAPTAQAPAQPAAPAQPPAAEPAAPAAP